MIGRYIDEYFTPQGASAPDVYVPKAPACPPPAQAPIVAPSSVDAVAASPFIPPIADSEG